MVLSDLTVVVPTRNERRNVGAFLRSLPADVDLLVIDASDDDTPSVVERLRPMRTRVVRRTAGITSARQYGADLATTRWMLITDADVIFDADYFRRLEAYANADVVYGPKLTAGGYDAYYRWFARGQRWLHAVGIPAASGSNLVVRTAAFRALGGFDLRLSCNEDSELAWRAKRRWALPWRPVLWAVVVLTAVAQGSWLLCEDRCPLTILEERLRGPQAHSPQRLPGDAEEPANFVVDLLSGLLGRPVPYRWTNNAIYAVTCFAFATACARLVFS